MNPLAKVSANIFLAMLLTPGAPARVSIASSGQEPNPGANQQKLESVSGQITAVSGKAFTLAASIVRSSASQQQPPEPQPGPAPHAMTFLVDANTTVSGKLTVGAAADVLYRTINGQNIALRVRVSA